MEKNEIDSKIAQKIAEAKLEVAEKRLQFVLWIFGFVITIFGVILPLYNTRKMDEAIDKLSIEQTKKLDLIDMAAKDNYSNLRELFKDAISIQNQYTSFSSKKVDDAVQDMQEQFKVLSGNQLRNPELRFFVNGKEIDTSLLVQPFSLEIKNVGDGTAKNVQIRFYSTLDNCSFYDNNANWNEYSKSDDPEYIRVMYLDNRLQLDPKESRIFEPTYSCEFKEQRIINCMIKIFYEQPEPKVYRFRMKLVF